MENYLFLLLGIIVSCLINSVIVCNLLKNATREYIKIKYYILQYMLEHSLELLSLI